MTKKQLTQLILTIGLIGTAIWSIVERPDIQIALDTIYYSLNQEEEDWRIKLAMQYMIRTEHHEVYEELSNKFWGCSEDSISFGPDYSARRAARILGENKGEGAFEAMASVFRHGPGIEGTSMCARYAVDGLMMKGEEGQAFVYSLAKGEFSPDIRSRCFAIRGLIKSEHTQYIDLIVDIVLNDETDRMRINAAYFLLQIGTDEAIEIVKRVAEEDESEYVREKVNELLERWGY